jgi:peroxiredoxin Q/BCP
MTHAAALLAAAVLLVGLAAAAPARALEVGQPAPPFEAESSTGKIVLADFQGKKNLLLAFYFADFTGG